MRFIGVDDGFNTSVTYTDKGELIISPTKIRIGASHAIQMAGVELDMLPAQYKTTDSGVEEMVFSVGAQTSDDIVHDDYPMSPQCRVMVHHGLHQVKYLDDTPLKVCTGLPIRKYYKRDGTKNESLIAQKNKSLLLPVSDIKSGKSIIITESYVMPESLSAIWDMVITERREPHKPHDVRPKVSVDKSKMKEHIAFFDIGGRTTDIAIWAGGSINKGEFDTINAGMEDVYREIRDYLRDETGLDAIPDSHIKAAYSNKGITLAGQEFDLSSVIMDAINETVAKIKNKASSVIGSKAKLINEVVFLGGGSQALYESGLKGMYDNQRLLEKPIAVNARSNYKWLRYIHSANAN